MVASRDLMDVIIICRKTGSRLGRAIGVDYHPGNKCIGGIICRRFGLFNRRILLPLESMRTMSAHVILADPFALSSTKNLARRIPEEPTGSIYLSDGRYLGEIYSLMLDEYTGAVEALVVRTSLMDDMRKGFLWLNDPKKLVATANHIILLT